MEFLNKISKKTTEKIKCMSDAFPVRSFHSTMHRKKNTAQPTVWPHSQRNVKRAGIVANIFL